MAADASPFPNPDRAPVDFRPGAAFTWSAEDPPLGPGYRIEWKFKTPEDEGKPRWKP